MEDFAHKQNDQLASLLKQALPSALLEEALALHNNPDVAAAEAKFLQGYEQNRADCVRMRQAVEAARDSQELRWNPTLAASFNRDLAVMDQALAGHFLLQDRREEAQIMLGMKHPDETAARGAIQNVEKLDPANESLGQLKAVEQELERRASQAS